jgi:hypothetical protein
MMHSLVGIPSAKVSVFRDFTLSQVVLFVASPQNLTEPYTISFLYKEVNGWRPLQVLRSAESPRRTINLRILEKWLG